MQNRIKNQLARGKPAFGAQLRFGSPAIAELCGHSGFDFLVIDSEHAPQTPDWHSGAIAGHRQYSGHAYRPPAAH